MATRPVFIPDLRNGRPAVQIHSIDFRWTAGLSLGQKRKNIAALHEAARTNRPGLRLLEVSRRSPLDLGVRLSAFNLRISYRRRPGLSACVESLYQASKVFQEGVGPFPAWYPKDPREVRQLVRDAGGTDLKAFQYGRTTWPLQPMRAFYDWLYCKVLHANPRLVKALHGYDAFTDIEFNPARSINCQGYAVALYLSLEQGGLLEEALSSQESFLDLHPADPLPGRPEISTRVEAPAPGKAAAKTTKPRRTPARKKTAATAAKRKAPPRKKGEDHKEEDGLDTLFDL